MQRQISKIDAGTYSSTTFLFLAHVAVFRNVK